MADGDKFKSPREIVSQGGRMKDTKPPKVHPTSRQGRGGDSQRSSAVNRYYAFKDSSNAFWEVMSSLDRLNIAYEYYGEDDTWSVLEIQGFAYSPPHRRTYEAALDYAKEGDRY